MARSILVVDDEATQRRLLETVIKREGYQVLTAVDGDEAIEKLTGPSAITVDLVILDLSMPRVSGIEVLQKVRPRHPNLPIIVLTAHSNLANVVDAMKAGATDFLSKPASAERIRNAMASAFKKTSLVGELDPVSSAIGEDLSFSDLIGRSPATQDVVALAKKAANSSIPVLIEGESGVGKELFARAIKQASIRGEKPFVTVNCGAIPEKLVESILFGHKKGAFTGADSDHVGKFEEADGGTLFLDEIGELPADAQVKLLRAIQEGEVDPVGGTTPVKVNIRLISATNRDLLSRVAEGRFREDLYYRLNVLPIKVPPLRERKADIAALARHFAKRLSDAEDLPARTITDEAIERLMAYDWPGNIRQLQNAIFRAMVMVDDGEIGADDFGLIGQSPQGTSYGGEDGSLPEANTFVGDDGHVMRMDEMERAIIEHAITHYNGKMVEVAKRLGIGRSTLYRKMEAYGLVAKASER